MPGHSQGQVIGIPAGAGEEPVRPSAASMAAKLRRVIIAARFKASHPDRPTPEDIRVIRLAWEDLAA